MNGDPNKEFFNANSQVQKAAGNRYRKAARAVARSRHGRAILFALTIILCWNILTLFQSAKARKILRQLNLYRRCLREASRFARRAVPTVAYPIMVNSQLRHPGTQQVVPGLVLIGFGCSPSDPVRILSSFSTTAKNDSAQQPSAADRALMAGLLADEQYVPHRRRKLELSNFKSGEFFACDLPIQRDLLFRGRILDEFPIFPCMAEPSMSGRILQMPFWIVEGREPGTEDERSAFLSSLLMLTMVKDLDSDVDSTGMTPKADG